MGTNALMYNLLRPDGSVPTLGPAWGDVRDVANAVVAASHAPPSSEVGRKRLVIGHDEWFSWHDAASHIAEARPELKVRLSALWKSDTKVPKSIVDSTRSKTVLGVELPPWKTTLLGTVDSLIEMENF